MTTRRMGAAPPIYMYPPRLSNLPLPAAPSLKKSGSSARGAIKGRWMLVIGPILLLILLILPYSILRAQQAPLYQPIQDGLKVAHVHATTNGTLNSMNVELTLYTSDGSISYHHTYRIQGEKWMLREEVVTYPAWTGLQSGYKIVQLTGYNAHSTNSATKNKDGGILNGGEDPFYSFLKGNAWTSSFGKTAEYKVYVTPGPRPLGTSYDIRLNADGSLRTQQLEKNG